MVQTLVCSTGGTCTGEMRMAVTLRTRNKPNQSAASSSTTHQKKLLDVYFPIAYMSVFPSQTSH